jgi:hypothetical protein
MPVQKQNVDIILRGLETGTDAKHTIPGDLLELENARCVVKGRINKRFGTSQVQSVSDLKRVFGLGKNAYQLRATPYETFERYDPTLGATISHGTLGAAKATAVTIGGGVSVNSSLEPSWIVDSARLNDTTIVYLINESVAAPSGVGARVIWYDTEKEAVIATVTNASAAGSNLRIMVVGSTIIVASWNSPDINIWTVTASGFTLRATVSGVFGSLLGWDWCADAAGDIYVFYVEATGSSTLCMTKINGTTWAMSSTATWAAAAAVTAVTVCANTTIRLFWSDGVAGLSTRTYSAALALTLGTTVVVADTDLRHHIGAVSKSNESVHLVWNVASAGSGGYYHRSIRYALVDTAGAPGTVVTTRGAALCSKPYVLTQGATDRVFAIGGLGLSLASAPSSDSYDEQRGYVLLEVARAPAMKARLLYGTAGFAPSTAVYNAFSGVVGLLVNLHQYGSSSSNFACAGTSFEQSTESAQNDGLRFPSPKLLRFSFDTSQGYQAVGFDGGLLISGGVLHSFDGRTLRENGYLVYPTIVEATQVAGGGAGLADGTYQIVAVYERTDALGRLVQSEVSPPKTVTIAGGGGTARIEADVTSYRLGLATEYERIVIYQTIRGGSVFLRSVVWTNDPRFDEVVCQTYAQDAFLTPMAQIYTTGTEPDHVQPSAPTTLAVDKGYVYVVPGDAQQQVHYSKPKVAGFGLSFFFDEYRAVPADDGPILALARMDGKIFAFKARSPYFAPGDGPDIDGGNNTLGEFERLPLAIGAAHERAVINTPDGIMTYGPTGICTLRRDLSVEPHSAVDGFVYNSSGPLTLRDACFGIDPVEGRKEARFLLSDARELVYNTEYGIWSLNPTLWALSMAVVDGNRHFVTDPAKAVFANGLYKESTLFYDAHIAGNYYLSFVLSWLKLAGLQGFGRAFSLGVLAEYLGDAWRLGVSFGFDYDTSWTTEQTKDVAGIAAAGGSVQVLVDLPRQQCQSLRARVRQLPPIGGITTDSAFSGLTLIAGMYPGANRLPATKRI